MHHTPIVKEHVGGWSVSGFCQLAITDVNFIKMRRLIFPLCLRSPPIEVRKYTLRTPEYRETTFVSVALAIYWRSMPAGYEFHLHLCVYSLLFYRNLFFTSIQSSSSTSHVPSVTFPFNTKNSTFLRTSFNHFQPLNVSTSWVSTKLYFYHPADPRLPTPESWVQCSVFNLNLFDHTLQQ
jgi:hypothetical protein